jgi:hypothetical protein
MLYIVRRIQTFSRVGVPPPSATAFSSPSCGCASLHARAPSRECLHTFAHRDRLRLICPRCPASFRSRISLCASTACATRSCTLPRIRPLAQDELTLCNREARLVLLHDHFRWRIVGLYRGAPIESVGGRGQSHTHHPQRTGSRPRCAFASLVRSVRFDAAERPPSGLAIATEFGQCR